MLCESKFNVLNRRHQCRACGRVLCSKCCSHRRELAYMPDPIVKHRVCEPCLKTLEKIEKHEIENGGASSSNGEVEEEAEVEGTEENGPGTSGETSAPAPIEPEQAPRTTKSALKIRKPDPEDPCSSTAPDFSEVLPKQSKRSVTFLDGVNPGEGGEDVTAAEALARATSSTNSNKPKKKSARRALSAHRMREMRIEEEPMCMFTGGSSVFVPKDDGTLEITDVASVEDELASGLPIVVALKRNLHAVVQLCDLKCCNQGRVICVSSRGIHAIGADEVVFVFEHSEGAEVKLPSDVLRKVDEIYMTCLDPLNSTADEKVGIRMVRDRMLKLYRVDNGSLDGFDVTRILLFKPTSQCLEHLPLPSTSFYFACYIKRSEVIWSLALPQRVLYKIGFQASCFPAAIVNKWNREPVYADQDYESSVLKVFTDFRNFSYRLSSIPGSTISLSDGAAIIELPTWAAEKVTTAVNANRNMIAWAADLNSEADSILVCEQDVDSASFKSSMFAKVADQRSVTGCSFVIFDGALKTLDDTMHVSIVEDGIVIRLRSTVMSSLVEKLLAGQDFEVESKAMNLSIRWVKSAISEENAYTTRSPIDGFCLEEQWQYGALLTRELRSLMPLQS
ncbi:hypothetical protein L596_018099 [Steinernema carpocapsae]|uniref:FYVE-type domain-containing protein n=1 Tax=Steinernema carpocapsae TaxID=34508 RepID=A0A4U5N3W2_STECR|nr:hypothetical protein L596_018099 [Steinernema carpocapsae]